MATLSPLYRRHELAFRTQYAELKEQARAAGPLLPGTPGTLYERHGTGYGYWYRVYYAMPGRQVEELVGSAGDSTALEAMRSRIEAALRMAGQVTDVRKRELQVADQGVARVLVELHNGGAFAAGLAVVGTLCYMAWLNELGAKAVAVRTQDLDLARRQRLKLATPLPFLETVQATRLPFVAVPGLPSESPSTSVKLPGPDGLRVDVLAPGRVLGAAVRVPELDWHAQAIPHYDYLLDEPTPAALLAGSHCVPVFLPSAERLIWHKVYASAMRHGEPEKASKDLLQAATLAAILVEQQDAPLADSFLAAPPALRSAARRRRTGLRRLLAAHPQALEQVEDAIG